MLPYNFWHHDVTPHAYENYDHPYDLRPLYALPPHNTQYGPPTTQYGVGSMYGVDSMYAHENDISNTNRLRAAYGYGHAHGTGMGAGHYSHAARFYGAPVQYYHNSSDGYVPGDYGLDHYTENLRNDVLMKEDCDVLKVGQGSGGMTSVLKGVVKKGVSTAVKAAKLHLNPENVDDHAELWKGYLANTSYTHSVQAAKLSAYRARQSSSFNPKINYFYVVFWHKGRVFSGRVDANDPGIKDWAKPNKPKKITIDLEGRNPKRGPYYGVENYIEQTVEQSKNAPKDCLHENVLFECFPDNRTPKEVSMYYESTFQQQQKTWLQMHPGRVHSWKTFHNFEQSLIDRADHDIMARDLGMPSM